MSFANTQDVKFFVFKYYLVLETGENVRKTTRFDSLLNGIKCCYSFLIKDGGMILPKISVFDKATKRRIISGTIDEIYESYLTTYDHTNVHFDEYTIEILGFLTQIGFDPSVYVKHPIVKNIMSINTKYALILLNTL